VGRLTVKGNNAEDEDQGQNEDNDRVDLESGGLVGVEAQHGAARAAGAGRTGAVGALVGNLLLLVGSSTAADGGTGTTGGRRRRGTASAGAARHAGGRAGW